MIRAIPRQSKRRSYRLGRLVWAALVAGVAGCGAKPPEATVEGTLRQRGRPLDNCLVTFLPEGSESGKARHSVAQTDAQGRYELRFADMKPGASVGTHRVLLSDLSASTGVRRIDHGTEEAEESGPPPVARAPRFGPQFGSERETPLRREIKRGNQVIDIDVH